MNSYLEEHRKKVLNGFYHQFRRNITTADMGKVTGPRGVGLSLNGRHRVLYEYVLPLEEPLVFPNEKIIFTRTLIGNPPYPQDDLEPSPVWGLENLSIDWGLLLAEGISGRRTAALKALEFHKGDAEAEDYLTNTIRVLDAIEVFAGRYADAAKTPEQKELLSRVPVYPARNFHEALQSMRFLTAVMRLSGSMHLGFGRFDQYAWPYLKADLDSGLLNRGQALELLEEFFISLSRDSDLYCGVQQGDNGQSLMLGGCDSNGKPAINPLTYMVLEASEAVGLIEPKINLRVDSNTPEDLLMTAARLTRRGLGFPQYNNDEIIIPALASYGYDLKAARNYTVAACWEFVVEDGRDMPNFCNMNFPLAADQAIREGLRAGDDSFEKILARLPETIQRQVDGLRKECEQNWRFLPELVVSAFSPGAFIRGRDLNLGGGCHYNYGCHGSGSANAADALAAVKTLIFEQKTVTPQRLLEALETDFEHDEELREMLKNAPHKVGNNDNEADMLMVRLFDIFADELGKIKDNGRGGRIRPGSGSAQNYVHMTEKREGQPLKATADGRKYGDFIGSSLAPSPGVHARGILSELQSYSKINYRKIINGGPITMELADAYFRNDEALVNVTKIIRAFVKLGCQQLQLNTLNPDKLRDAQKHPENYRDLIVRVWGWSGYFIELAKPFQDQIIGRQAFGA